MPTAAELTARLEAAEKKADALAGERLVETKTKGYTPKASDVFGLPSARKGESALTSRGFRISNLILGMLEGNHDNCKVEKSVSDDLRRAFPGGVGTEAWERNSFLAPFCNDFLPEQVSGDPQFGQRIKSMFYAGAADVDPDEVRHIAQKSYQGGRYKDMSWLDQYSGGAMVGMPAQGEMIDLFRNTSALDQAGVTTIPLPPTGRIQYPRQTTATTAYWLGENAAGTASQPGTGLLTLSAKKLFAYTPLPNELLRFGGAAAEMLVRKDLATSLALGIDLAGLQGVGSDTSPRGINYTPGVQTVTPTTVATDGNTLAPEDIYSWMQKVEEANGTFESFVMTPTMYWALLKRRTGAANATDAGGLFAFSPFRQLGDALGQKNINGFKVVTSNQVSRTVVKGSGTNLTTVYGGQFSDCLLAMFGAIEFAVTTTGDTAFKQDQTWIRGIAIGDFGIKHPGTMAYATSLLQV